MFDTVRLPELAGTMLLGLADGRLAHRLMPAFSAVADIGDFAANQARLRKLSTPANDRIQRNVVSALRWLTLFIGEEGACQFRSDSLGRLYPEAG